MANNSETESSAPQTPEKKAGWKELFRDGRGPYTALLNLGIGLHALDIFIITTVMPTVVTDIGGLSYYTWTSMLYMVGSIVGAAAGSHLRARLGTRRGYFWGGVVLLSGTIGCAIAPDMTTLLAGRLIKGIGGGLIISQSMALVSDLYPSTMRTRILAAITTTWSVAALFGPGIGGVFGELGWWRGAFWAQAPFIVGFVWASWSLVPNSDAAAPDRRFPWRRLVLLASGVIAVGLTSQFKEMQINGGLIILAVGLLWLTFRIDEGADHSLFPTRALSAFSAVGQAYWVYFLISVTHSALLIFTPLFLDVLHQVTPLFIGYLSLIFSVGWTAGSIFASGRSGIWERGTSVAGMVFTSLATMLFAGAVLDGDLVMMTIWIAAAGLGIGATNVLMTSFGMSVARAGEEAITASSMPMIRSLGVAFGAAAAGLVANMAGLEEGTTPGTVANVAVWVLGFTAVTPLIASLFALAAVTWGWQFRSNR